MDGAPVGRRGEGQADGQKLGVSHKKSVTRSTGSSFFEPVFPSWLLEKEQASSTTIIDKVANGESIGCRDKCSSLFA